MVSSPPMRQTKNKLIRQKTEKNREKQKTKKPMLRESMEGFNDTRVWLFDTLLFMTILH